MTSTFFREQKRKGFPERAARISSWGGPTFIRILGLILFPALFIVSAPATTRHFTPGNLLAVSDGVVREYTPAGVETQNMLILYPEAASAREVVRDIVVYGNGHLGTYNGTFEPFLSTLAPDTATWWQPICSGWSTVDRPGYGGIATLGNFVYVSDMRTFGSIEQRASGIVRFDIRDFSCTRFAPESEFIDLTIGQDGLLYGFTDARALRVYNPADMTFLKSIRLVPADHRAVAVNRDGDVFTAAANGRIFHLDGTDGTVVKNSLNVGGILADIDLSSEGLIVVASAEGDVVLTSEELGAFTSFKGGTFVAWVPPYERTEMMFSVPAGSFSLLTDGGSSRVSAGYASVEPLPFHSAPSGFAILGHRQDGILVSESELVASGPVTGGRIFAELGGGSRTGVSVANPNSETATIDFHFTDWNGVDLGAGSVDIPGGAQVVRFLGEDPFLIERGLFAGTFTFRSSVPVTVGAIRGFTNERSEFLATTIPVTGLVGARTRTVVIPHFAQGGGWTSDLVLLNSSDNAIRGSVRFLGQGTPLAPAGEISVILDGQSGDEFEYSVPPRSVRRMRMLGPASPTRTGSVQISPATLEIAPAAFIILSYRPGDFTISETVLEASPLSPAFRMYAEVSGQEGQAGSTRTAIAVANLAPGPATLAFELLSTDGVPLGLVGSATVPGRGQLAVFLNQVRGLEALPLPFRGVLRITTSEGEGIAVAALRGRINERRDFLLVATPARVEGTFELRTDVFLPLLVVGGGYSTEFILFAGSRNQTTSGTLRFLSATGAPQTVRVP